MKKSPGAHSQVKVDYLRKSKDFRDSHKSHIFISLDLYFFVVRQTCKFTGLPQSQGISDHGIPARNYNRIPNDGSSICGTIRAIHNEISPIHRCLHLESASSRRESAGVASIRRERTCPPSHDSRRQSQSMPPTRLSNWGTSCADRRTGATCDVVDSFVK